MTPATSNDSISPEAVSRKEIIMSNMNTFTGKKFDPLNMTTEDVSLEDIAHALSLMCRGGGHLKHFYSVGQHSINCMKEAKARNYPERIQLACLLHDASEAYIADIIRPVKVHLPDYYKIEAEIMNCIFKKFGLSYYCNDVHDIVTLQQPLPQANKNGCCSILSEEEAAAWKQIDDEILDHELKNLMVGERDRAVKQLSSVPDVSEKNWQEVCDEFIAIATRLQYPDPQRQ